MLLVTIAECGCTAITSSPDDGSSSDSGGLVDASSVRDGTFHTDSAPPMGGAFYGQVGTRTAVANIATFPNAMVRTGHFLRSNEAVSGLWVAYPNWMVTVNAGVGEESDGGTLTGRSAIELPNGAITQCTYPGGATSGTAPGMTELWCYCPVTLQPGDKFFMRTSLTTTGGYLPASERHMDSTFGDALEVTTADKTLSGTIDNNGNGAMYPIAIVGLTTRPSAAFVNCDSRVAGAGDTVPGDGSGDWGMFARPLGGSYAYQNLGVSGDVANGWVSRSARRIAIAQWSSTWLGENAVNQIGFGLTTTETDILAAASAAHAANRRYGHATVEPKTTGSWDAPDGSDQARDPSYATFFTPINDWLRTTPSGMDFYLELADSVEISRNSGLWRAPGYTPDGLHPSAVGNMAIDLSSSIDTIFPAMSYDSFMPSSPPF